MDDILNIIKQMRKSPPKGKDDPRFDELEEAVSMYGEDDLLEGEELDIESEELGDEAIDEEIPVDEDEALMNEAMGVGAEDPLAEEDEEALAEDPIKAKKKKNPLMKKSSYLDI